MSAPVTRVISGYDSPEGPAFAADGGLYFVNWLSSAIVRLTPDGVAGEVFNTGGIPAGLAFHQDGSLYVADEGDVIHGVLRIADGQAEIVVNEYEGHPLNGAEAAWCSTRTAFSISLIPGDRRREPDRRVLPPLPQ